MSKEFYIKSGEKFLAIIKNFSATEKTIFGFFVLIALISALSMVWTINKYFLVSVPAHGGTLTEGIVGLPRSINPVLAFTDVDRDLSNLIYAGLMKYEKGNLIPDLAEKYNISPDGLIYTFTLRNKLHFHDGAKLTTDDVEFTIQKAQDNIIKSPRRADWANIIMKKVSPKEIQFILKQPYSPFLMNTTIGILPKHIWNKVDSEQFIFSQYNIEPIGSGPYELDKIKKNSDGIPISYTLSSFSQDDKEEAFISKLHIYFYPNEKTALEDYTKGTIEAISRISAGEAKRVASTTLNDNIFHTSLPRIFGIFFNQNQATILTRNEVRQALNLAVDKNRIVNEVLFGYGIERDGPLLLNSVSYSSNRIPDDKSKEIMENRINQAKAILEKAGWSENDKGVMERKNKKGSEILELSIATADSPDLKQTAEIIKKGWEKIGARVTIKVFEYGDLYQNIISTRKYDALLFGESVGKNLDLYAFWHSSQRNSPGLNVAMYVNTKVDKLLEESRATLSAEKRDSVNSQIEKIIKEEVPAIFLYSPEFIYVMPKRVRGFELEDIASPSDRFYGIDKWYINTNNVWKIFNETK
ncbi:MAG TPA: ABC transporter substrate-binding protein [Candidatus Paceibacterota bacterium]